MRKLYFLFLTVLFMATVTVSHAQPCTGTPVTFTNSTPVAIPTGPAVVTSTINVSGLSTFIYDVNLTTFIQHINSSDLDVTLTSPAGTVVTLTTDNGGTLDNVFNGTVWDDDANPLGQVPYTSNNGLVTDHIYTNLVVATPLVPEEPLAAFIGENPNGTWTLTISDDLTNNGGTLASWSLTISPVPPAPILVSATYSQNTPVAIVDNTTVTSSIVVAGAGTQIFDVNLTTFITHTFPGDLDITLTSPAGTIVTITTDNGSLNDNVFNGTIWDDDANPLGQVPYTNNNGMVTDHLYANLTLASPLTPEEALGAFIGENPNGTWTIRISDDAGGDIGSLASWSMQIQTSDCIPPSCILTCPANITVSNDPNQCGAVVNYPAPTSSGICGTITTTPASGSFFPVGTTSVIASTSSGGGSCSFTIRVNDTQAPTITCPANITASSSATQCGANVNFTVIASDNCPGVVITSVPASGSFFPVGLTTVISTARDAAGNTATCSFTVRVNDVTPPTITCPANITVSNTTNQCGANVSFQPTASDNCPIPGGTPVALTQSQSQVPTALSSVSCNAGGIHTDNSYYRVYDLAPSGLPGPLTITNVVFGIEQATSGGGTQPVVVRIHTLVGTFNLANLTLRGQQTFNVPNQSLSTFTATLGTPIVVPGNSVVVVEIFTPAGAGNSFFLGANGQPETGPSYIAASACGIVNPVTTASVGFPNTHWIININGTSNNGSSIITSVPASGSFFPVGTTTVTSTATDPAGNTATCTFTVRVNDTQAPVINCPANVTVTTLPGQCTFAYTYAITSSDNCPGVTQAQVSGLASGAAYPLGVTTNTWRATDAAGNVTNCTWTITVLDFQLPVISVQPANTSACAGSNATFSVTSTNALNYQWQISAGGGVWNNIAGATGPTYTINNVTHAMNTNTYRVQVIGLCTTVTSGFATLTVNALPTVAIEPSIAEPLLPGDLLTLTAVASPGGGSYVWKRNGTIVFTGGPVLSGLTVDDAGSYTVTYTDINGCVMTSTAHVVEANASDFLYVYPNPNFGQFGVRFFNGTGEAMTVKVYDSKGAKVYEQRATTNLPYSEVQVKLNSFTGTGIYLVEVYNASGKRVGAKRVLVRHQ